MAECAWRNGVYVSGTESIRSEEQLREHVVKSGSFSPERNRAIFDACFSGARAKDRMFEAMAREFHLDRRRVCDAGCGYGAHLVRCGPGSFGIDIDKEKIAFARAIGLDAHARDLVHDDLADLPRADAVWCSAIIEHLDAPHVFLRKLNSLLEPGGLLLLETPVLAPLPWLGRLPLPKFRDVFLGDHPDHVNAFTPGTIRHACEYAGFATKKMFRWSLPIVNRAPFLPLRLTGLPPFSAVARAVMYVGEKIPGWDYPERASRRASDNRQGYVRK